MTVRAEDVRTMAAAGRRPGRRAASSALRRVLPPPVTDLAVGRRRVTVLAYHRIADLRDPARVGDPGVVSASPAGFTRQIRHVAREFDVIALDDLVAHVRGEGPLPERPLLITFDDGYMDNHEAAFPVLRAAGLPAVLFLITGAVGTSRMMWWDRLAEAVARTPLTRADLPLAGPRDLEGPRARVAARSALLARMKEVGDDERRAAMEAVEAALDVETPEGPPLFMGWDEVARLEAGGVSCQPHTVEHPLLTRVDRARARDEVRESVRAIHERTGRRPTAFAYPNGSYDAATPGILRAEGIEVAFTMRLGPSRAEEVLRRPLEIARVPIEDDDGFDLFRLKVGGGLAAIQRARGFVRGRPG